MKNTKDLISKAKSFYENRNYFKAKSHLFEALNDTQIDEITKSKLYILIADTCYKINEFDNTEKYLLKYTKEFNINSELLNWLGNTYLKKRDYKNSEKFYLKSIKLNSNNEIALINLAILYHNLGDQKKAIEFYQKILSINPKNIGALYNLSNIDRSVINEKNLKILKSLIKEKKLSNFNIASCYFLLAENEKNKKNFENEIKLLSEANKYSFKEKENKNKQVNEYWLKIIPKKFNKIQYSTNNESLIETKIYPIFIIGLPRCGSTLIESIISSGKNKVENLGETNLVNWAFLNSNRDILQNRTDEEKKILINFGITADRLKNSINNLNIKKNEKCILSEKSLENFYYIELILNIYPNAKFINPYRNLIDNIFAIYKQFLSNVSWSHSIDDILLYIDNYLFTMNYFKQKYPNKIFSIPLESFTNNPKKLAMEMYEFCNLMWDDKCLEFHKRKDLFINTASNNQIRNSVQKYDVNKYQYYKQILDPYLKRYDWINLSLRN